MKNSSIKGIVLALILTSQAYGQQTVLTSWYGARFHGKETAYQERFDMNALTCAHPWLPVNTKVFIYYPKTMRSVVARVNDRGPFYYDYRHGRQRELDISLACARILGLEYVGVDWCIIRPIPVNLVIPKVNRRD